MSERSNAKYYSGAKDDSAMIQAAVDAAHLAGEPAIVPKRNPRTGKDIWIISRAIELYSSSTLLLQDCHIRMADGVCCNMFKNSNRLTEAAKMLAGRQYDMTIRGIGHPLLDGGLYNGLTEHIACKNGCSIVVENHIICFHNAERITIDNIRVADQRYWAMAFYFCSDSRISNIAFESCGNVPNQDGIDLRIGCHDFLIENITGCTGDDVIALTAVDHGFDNSTRVEGLDPDIHNVIIRNLLVYGVGGCNLIRLLNHDKVKLYNISIDNVIECSPWSKEDRRRAVNVDIPKYIENGRFEMKAPIKKGEFGYRVGAALCIGDTGWFDPEKGPAKMSDTYGISVRNIVTHAQLAIRLSQALSDSHFENIRIFGNGYMAVLFSHGDFADLSFENITYDADAAPHRDDEPGGGHKAVFFAESNAKNISFDKMTVGKGIETVFSGTGSIELRAERIRCRNSQTVLCDSKNIKLEP